jgi:hypothetical protein
LAPGFRPQSFEHQGWADALHGDGGRITGPGRIQNHRLLDEARAGTDQPIELSAGLELIQPPQGGDHALPYLIAGSMALDDLQVDAPLRLLAAEVHAPDSIWCAQDVTVARTCKE